MESAYRGIHFDLRCLQTGPGGVFAHAVWHPCLGQAVPGFRSKPGPTMTAHNLSELCDGAVLRFETIGGPVLWESPMFPVPISEPVWFTRWLDSPTTLALVNASGQTSRLELPVRWWVELLVADLSVPKHRTRDQQERDAQAIAATTGGHVRL